MFMKNVAIIITKLNGGGAERCASNLSIELSKKYNVFLIVFDASDITYPYLGTLVDLKIPKAQSSLSRYIGVFKRACQIRKLKKAYNIDVSISLLEGPNLVNVLSKWKDKTIVSVRNNMSRQAGGRIARTIIKYASKKADLTITLSKMVGKDLIYNFGINPDKIKTIYNHVDKDLLAQQNNKSSLILDPTKKYVVTIGRMHPQKGQWHLIKAFKKVSERCPDLNLLILGDGPLRQSLEKLVNELDLQDRVIMPGYIEAPHTFFSKCEMFVLSSLYEGLGNVLLEAEVFGLPIISTDCQSGPREILSPDSDLTSTTNDIEYGKYGILVPVDESKEINSQSDRSNQEDKMADAIITLHNNKNLIDNYKILSIEGADRFSKEKIINDWRALID